MYVPYLVLYIFIYLDGLLSPVGFVFFFGFYFYFIAGNTIESIVNYYCEGNSCAKCWLNKVLKLV